MLGVVQAIGYHGSKLEMYRRAMDTRLGAGTVRSSPPPAFGLSRFVSSRLTVCQARW